MKPSFLKCMAKKLQRLRIWEDKGIAINVNSNMLAKFMPVRNRPMPGVADLKRQERNLFPLDLGNEIQCIY